MSQTRTYPHGVPSWIDTEQPDVEAAAAFYGALFGWSFVEATPTGSPFRYLIAQLDGQDAAGIGGPASTRTSPSAPGDQLGDGPAGWHTYIAVDDADATSAQVESAGGSVVAAPSDAGEGGRSAIYADPAGATFRVWQARRRPGAQVVNSPGAWNFSDLRAGDPSVDAAFYVELFGWEVEDLGFATMIRQPGYGEHLETTCDPDIRARQAAIHAPPGFEDAIAWVHPVPPNQAPGWHVSFTVADRDATAADVERHGGTVLAREDTQWTRTALIRDPQGAQFTASQFSAG
jgi:uncharacterized protein